MNQSAQSAGHIVLFLLYVLGAAITIPLVQHSLHPDDSIVNKICSDNNALRIACTDILDSKAASFLGILHWSEIGLIYFIGEAVSLIGVHDHARMGFLSWLGLLALPYTAFSILYQAFVARQWCIFCMAVQVLLWIQFIFLFPFLDSFPSAQVIMQSFLPFLALLATYLLLRPLFRKASVYKSIIAPFRLFKTNTGLFNATLKKQKKLVIERQNLTYKIGNENALHTIVFFTNPLCYACSKRFKEILELCKADESRFNAVIIFKVDKKNSKSFRAASYMFHLYHTLTAGECLDALAHWHKEWGSRYAYKHDAPQYDEILLSHKNYCKLNTIKAVPTVFIDNYLLPEYYSLSDAGNLIHHD